MQFSLTCRIGLLFFFSSLMACNHRPGHQSILDTTGEKSTFEKPLSKNFPKGEVIKEIPVLDHNSESFSLYLPKSYSDSSRFPVIIFFDPHGDGSLPTNLYHELADRYDYILIGSNTSKNGLSFDQTRTIAIHLINEAKKRFTVDKSKIALCGLSGGAKIALLSGALNPDVSSVIYCGAAIAIAPDHPLSLLGFAGTGDMNYTDVVLFDQGLKNLSTKHYLVEWDGKHEFPKADVFTDAFEFLKTGNVTNYPKKQVTITPDKLAEEQNLQQQYFHSFQTRSIGWWQNEIASLNHKKQKDLMYERLLGFISLTCYSLANNALRENNITTAEKILAIYRMADPDNEDCKKFTTELKNKKISSGFAF